jgi:hypothetical protein
MSVLARLWALRDRRPVFVAVAVVVLAFLLAYPFFDWYVRSLRVAGVAGFERVTPFTFNDYSAFGGAVERFYAGDLVYWQKDGSYHGSFLYPPAYVLLFVPFYEAGASTLFASLPFADGGFQAGAISWELATTLLLWVALQLLARELGADLAAYERVGLLWLLFGFQPLLYSFKWTQTAAFQTALLALAYVGLSRGRTGDGPGGDGDGGSRLHRVASGAATTVASGMKPFYAASGAHLLRDRDRFVGAIAAGVGILVVSLWVGVDQLLTYFEVLTWGKGWSQAPRGPWEFWLPTYYYPLHSVANLSTTLALAVRALGVVAIVALVWVARRAPAGRETFALGVAAVPLLGPTVHVYDLAALLPAALVLLAVEFDRPGGGRPALVVGSVGLLGAQAYGLKLLVDSLPTVVVGDWAVHTVHLTSVLQPGLWGNLLLVGLAAYRVAEHVPAVPLGRPAVGRDPANAPE